MLNNLNKEQQLIIFGLVLVIISGLGVMLYRRSAPAEADDIVIEEPGEAAQKIELIVHVAGAVKKEGVYRLNSGDRVMDALKLAGGISIKADLSSLNLAEKLKDGDKIIVPVKPEMLERGSGSPDVGASGKSISAQGKISINSAGEQELCKVPGIGPSTAKKIIEYRSANGPFSKIDDIMKVKSIGKGKFGKIKDNITI